MSFYHVPGFIHSLQKPLIQPPGKWPNDQNSECNNTDILKCKLADGHKISCKLCYRYDLYFEIRHFLDTYNVCCLKWSKKNKKFADNTGPRPQVKSEWNAHLFGPYRESHSKTLTQKFRTVNDTKNGTQRSDYYWTVPIPVYENVWEIDSKYVRQKINKSN
jgi:hypothetical protein